MLLSLMLMSMSFLLNNNITTSATTTAANAAPAKRFGRTDESGVHRISKHSEHSTNQMVVFVYVCFFGDVVLKE
jgi:hypothetical protein